MAQTGTSVEGLIQQLLEEVSLEKGGTMDTAAIHRLFHPKALITVRNPQDDNLESVGLNEFLLFLTDESYQAGFEEWELKKVVYEYEGIACAWQSFRGKAAEGPEIQGVNSYQFAYHNGRWWIMSLVWTFDQGAGLAEAFKSRP